jgi:hypothetical protein
MQVLGCRATLSAAAGPRRVFSTHQIAVRALAPRDGQRFCGARVPPRVSELRVRLSTIGRAAPKGSPPGSGCGVRPGQQR